MRRIIERVVTVVTTTTWKISWEADPPHANHTGEPASENLPHADELTQTAQDAQTISSVIGETEDDLWLEKPLNTQTPEHLPENAHSYKTKKGNEKS